MTKTMLMSIACVALVAFFIACVYIPAGESMRNKEAELQVLLQCKYPNGFTLERTLPGAPRNGSRVSYLLRWLGINASKYGLYVRAADVKAECYIEKTEDWQIIEEGRPIQDMRAPG